ncbi:hypothetical protein [Marinicella meishanensis]|uniref:hypothetical protein n=1 Tax=Marinicella meishanensis TaxID=2873263 RepID=UPI001CC0344F|nr:hypothetical protein [Marinicella sp. NBU2979]
MATEIDDFDAADLKFLKDLKFIFENFNPNFVAGLYNPYIPLGVLIVQVISIHEPINKDKFTKDEFTLYAKYVNWEYIKFATLVAKAIKNGLKLIDPKTRIPIEDEILMDYLNQLADGHADDYTSILALRVAYDEISNYLKQMPGLSVNDPNIVAIDMIRHEMMSQPTPSLQPNYLINNLIYSPIKDCINKEGTAAPDDKNNELDIFLTGIFKILGRLKKTKNYILIHNALMLMKSKMPQSQEAVIRFGTLYQFILDNKNGIPVIKSATSSQIVFKFYDAELGQEIDAVVVKKNLRKAYDKLIRPLR